MVLEYVFALSQFLYQLIASDAVTQELLAAVLQIYRNTEMLVFYKTDSFKTKMRQMMSIVLLQVRERGGGEA